MGTGDFDIEFRLERSARILRAWNWMAPISNRRSEIVEILTHEARELIMLGPNHPRHARRIGKLIVAYGRLIEALSERTTQKAA